MSSFIVIFLLFLLPFVIAPFGSTFEIPKVILAEGVIILLFFISLFSDTISFLHRKSPLFLYVALFAITAIDLLFFQTKISFFGNAFRMQGIFLLWLFLIFSFLSANIRFKKTPWWAYGFLLYLELVATLLLPLNASHRHVGTLGEPNALAGFVIFLFPFAWFGIRKTPKIVMKRIVLLLPVGMILYLSWSYSGMVALGIELVCIVLQKINITKNVLLCLFLYALSYALPFFQHDLYENRVQVWQSALFAGLKNPFIGQGFGNTEYALHAASSKLGLPIQYYYVDSSHNIFLDWWVQGGIVGVSILVIFITYAFIHFIRKGKQREVVLLLGLLIVLSFNPASVVELVGFWWIIGQSFHYAEQTKVITS